MKFLVYSLMLGLVAWASAVKIPARRVKTGAKFSATSLSSAGPNNNNLGNVQNVRYVTNITINGLEFLVLLDTGSTDLWVVKPNQLSNFNDTGLKAGETYGSGDSVITGSIGIGEFHFGSYSVPNQAFLNLDSINITGVVELGIGGLLGLAFDDARSSVIHQTIMEKYGKDATWGQSVLSNIFEQNPSLPNLIGISLSRTDDLEGTADGLFTIGEIDEDYSSITSAPRLPQFPPNGDRWGTPMEGFTVNGKDIALASNVSGAPKDTTIVVFDTGTPGASLSDTIVNAIYSDVPGAAFSDDPGVWVVPCNASISAVATFAGQQFPIHPADMSNPTVLTVGGRNYTACIAAFASATGLADETLDGLFGDSWMRNVYTIFDFGDTDGKGKTTSPASMQLLSLTNATEAALDFASVRAQTLAGMPPELAPATLIQLDRQSRGNPSDGTSVGSMASAAVASDQDSTDAAVARYAPWVLGLLSANVLFGLILVALGVAAYVRRGAQRALPRSVITPFMPVQLEDDRPLTAEKYDAPYSD